MKLANVVGRFLKSKVDHVFTVSGGASLHLIHGCVDEGVKIVCPQHELSAGYAADAYARLRGMGCAIATSGPGATNLFTSIASSYYDSVPVLYIVGQVNRDRLSGTSGVRQKGFQECPTIPMATHISKYAVTVMDPDDIERKLEAACFFARDGRPGPVVVEIPDDVQRAEVCPQEPFEPLGGSSDLDLPENVREIVRLIHKAKKPVFVFGWGVRLSNCISECQELANELEIPVLPTWAVRDAFPDSLGAFGTHGNLAPNLAIQNADLVISIGSRLDSKATSSPPELFAPKAKVVMVDIDWHETEKGGRHIDLKIVGDAKHVVNMLLNNVRGVKQHEGSFPDFSEWWREIGIFKYDYPVSTTYPYRLMSRLSAETREDSIIVSDTGLTLAWAMQGWKFKNGQRFIHPFNNTPMGYGLPGAIGAYFATGKPVTLLTGDGSIMMSLQELATVKKHNIPLKIVLLDNKGHGMCRQTQRMWLGGKYYSTSTDDLAFPDFKKVSEAFGVPIEVIEIDPNESLIPQVRYGKALDDPE